MIQLYRQQSIYGQLWIYSLAGLLFLNYWCAHLLFQPLEFTLIGWQQSYLSIALSCIIIILCALLTNNICNRYQLTASNSNLPAALTIIYTSFLFYLSNNLSWAIVLFILLLIFNKLFKAYQKNKPEPNFFDAAFLIGCLSLFYPPFSVILIALFFSIVIVTIAKPHHFLISTIAFIIPWVLFLTFLFIINKTKIYFNYTNTFFKPHIIHNILKPDKIDVAITTIPFLASFILGVFLFQKNSYKLQHLQKTLLSISTSFLIVVFFMLLAWNTRQLEISVALILPTAILMTYYFFYASKNLAKLLFIFLLIIVFALPWVQFLTILS